MLKFNWPGLVVFEGLKSNPGFEKLFPTNSNTDFTHHISLLMTELQSDKVTAYKKLTELAGVICDWNLLN